MTRVAVAGPSSYSVDAGARAVAAGGNAVDAALSGVLAAMVSEPGVASLGGGAFVTVAPPGGPAVTVDGSVSMPGTGLPRSAFGRGLESLYLEYGGGTHLDVGPGSVATPGALAALETAHRRFGRAPWAEVVAAAADLARAGFRIGRAAGTYLSYAAEPLFGRDPAARSVLTGPGGEPLGTGDTMLLPELGDFLDLVATEGAAALHRGEVARALVAEMSRSGGLLTAADLEGYRAVVRPALQARIGGWQWATNPPPAVGGPVLTAMLQLLARPEAGLGAAGLDGAGLGAAGGGEARVPGGPLPSLGKLVAVQEAVLSYRIRRLDVAPDRIAAARELLARIAPGGSGRAGGLGDSAGQGGGGGSRLGGSPSTVHVSAVDAEGLACAVTASAGYGAGISVPGTGIWLNNCLGERELNRRGPHALAPGERLVSNMAPTVGRHDDGRVLAIGSPGADRIATAVLQVLLGLLAGDSLERAIERPRVHVTCDDEGRPATVEYEADLLSPGWAITHADHAPGARRWREHPPRSMFFGGVAAALRAADGTLEAAADGRREGGVAVV